MSNFCLSFTKIKLDIIYVLINEVQTERSYKILSLKNINVRYYLA